MTGFRMALTRAINDYGRKIRRFQSRIDPMTGDDTKEGLTAVVFIKMPQDKIQFEGQTKENSEILKSNQSSIRLLKKSLATHFEENPTDGKKNS